MEKDFTVEAAQKSDFNELDDFYNAHFPFGLSRVLLNKCNSGQDKCGRFIVIRHDKQIIAAGYVRVCGEEFGYFSSWLVHPDYRRYVLATLLDKYGFEILKKNGVGGVHLSVSFQNKDSLDRLEHLKKKYGASIKDIGEVAIVYLTRKPFIEGILTTGLVRRAIDGDKEICLSFLNTSTVKIENIILYGEDKDFHLLVQNHLERLIDEERVCVLISGSSVVGMVIVNPKSFISDKFKKEVIEIQFVAGNVEPIMIYLSDKSGPETIFRVYLFDEKLIERFTKIGFNFFEWKGVEEKIKKYKFFTYQLKEDSG